VSRSSAWVEEPDLFEQWMGITQEEWEALGAADDDPAEDQPRLI
jgi:hypothetical protein